MATLRAMGTLRDDIIHRDDKAHHVRQRNTGGHNQNPLVSSVVDAFANPSSPTFGQKTASYAIAAPGKAATHSNRQAVSQAAHNLLNTQKAQSLIKQTLAQHSADLPRRTAELSQVMHGTVEEKAIEYDREGNEIRRLVRSTRVADRLKAIDILNKLDGSYAEAEAQVDVQSHALKQLISKHAKVLEGG